MESAIRGSLSFRQSRLLQYVGWDTSRGFPFGSTVIRHEGSVDEGFHSDCEESIEPGLSNTGDTRMKLANYKLDETENVVIISNLATDSNTASWVQEDMLKCCKIDPPVVVKYSKLKEIAYVYNLRSEEQEILARYLRRHLPRVKVTQTIGVMPYNRSPDVTELILKILEENDCDEISYTDIYKYAPIPFLILPENFPFDTNVLVEVRQKHFYGIKRRRFGGQSALTSKHILTQISVRRLAHFVHGMISNGSQNLTPEFLHRLNFAITNSSEHSSKRDNLAFAVKGEGTQKPLEHLVACVPGVEVVWIEGEKIVRKLELPLKETTLSRGSPIPYNLQEKASPAKDKNVVDVVKVLTDILKEPSNLYMSMPSLHKALTERLEIISKNPENRDRHFVKFDGDLRLFIMERPKHFQILGEAEYEVVTLSHRAQIKRVCNDMQKVLRPRKPKCIASSEIEEEFNAHWKSTTAEADRTFNVEHFGVCYLDCLIVTIPQHWGVQCSEYVSPEGQLVKRERGDGPEQIPEFIPVNDDLVYAWTPRQVQSDFQIKEFARLKEQVLNMYRIDPTAVKFVSSCKNRNIDHPLLRSANLRAIRYMNAPAGLPVNFQMDEKSFVPMYHRYYGEQLTLSIYGIKTLYALFDKLSDSFMPEIVGQERNIKLTTEARKNLIERIQIDILRDRPPLHYRTLLSTYQNDFIRCSDKHEIKFDEFEFREVLKRSKIIYEVSNNVFSAKPFFKCSSAIEYDPDVETVLKIFILSCSPLSFAKVASKFHSATNRVLRPETLEYLEQKGAIRRLYNVAKFDLHDICRVVRNLIYMMNKTPDKKFVVNQNYYLHGNVQSQHVSITYLLAFTGDYTYMDIELLSKVIDDFSMCFQYNKKSGECQLRSEFIAWQMTPEEREASHSKKEKRGSQQYVPQSRCRSSYGSRRA